MQCFGSVLLKISEVCCQGPVNNGAILKRRVADIRHMNFQSKTLELSTLELSRLPGIDKSPVH